MNVNRADTLNFPFILFPPPLPFTKHGHRFQRSSQAVGKLVVMQWATSSLPNLSSFACSLICSYHCLVVARSTLYPLLKLVTEGR